MMLQKRDRKREGEGDERIEIASDSCVCESSDSMRINRYKKNPFINRITASPTERRGVCKRKKRV